MTCIDFCYLIIKILYCGFLVINHFNQSLDNFLIPSLRIYIFGLILRCLLTKTGINCFLLNDIKFYKNFKVHKLYFFLNIIVWNITIYRSNYRRGHLQTILWYLLHCLWLSLILMGWVLRSISRLVYLLLTIILWSLILETRLIKRLRNSIISWCIGNLLRSLYVLGWLLFRRLLLRLIRFLISKLGLGILNSLLLGLLSLLDHGYCLLIITNME